MYIDSPVWRREQIESGATTGIREYGKGDKNDVKMLTFEHQPKSDCKNLNGETIELQASALYRIAAGATKNGARTSYKNEIV